MPARGPGSRSGGCPRGRTRRSHRPARRCGARRGRQAVPLVRLYPPPQTPPAQTTTAQTTTARLREQPGRRKKDSSADDDRENVAGREDQVVLAAELDLGATVLGVDDLVADGDIERDAVAVVVDAAGAHGDDLALLRLLLGGVGDDQTGSSGLLSLDLLDDDAILERLDGDRHVDPFPVKNSVLTKTD